MSASTEKSSKVITERDLESAVEISDHLTNTNVESFSWKDVGVIVKDRTNGQPLSILSSNHGHIEAGNVLALMGPSGSGKTTLLNVLANRIPSASNEVSGTIMVDGKKISQNKLEQISSYVEQEDALIGSLTVRETVDFAARLSLPISLNKKERLQQVDEIIESFGLSRQSSALVGTPLRKGISGGQKRRLSVASQLVTSPRILFLDEPTSGLDSAASYEVMKYITQVAKQHKLIIIASIHQPSTATFQLFDKLMLLSQGKTCFFGLLSNLEAYFTSINRPIPLQINPAEFLLDSINSDFLKDTEVSKEKVEYFTRSWGSSPNSDSLHRYLGEHTNGEVSFVSTIESRGKPRLLTPLILLHRNWIKSYRDFLAFGIRIAMYGGLAIMMGTVWLRLEYHQSSIQPWTNAIFFGGAFMSFMAVGYIPAAIEDLHSFRKERANGLYGPLAFMVANFLIGLPWLFLSTITFSLISYWLGNFYPTAQGFWMFFLWLYLDLLAAEGLVLLMTCLFPIFVVALVITAFANGLWMCVNGFMVPIGTLNAFWKYVFHYIDYQAYVFQGMMVNQFKDSIYDCEKNNDGSYQCMYASDLQAEGKIRGTAVLDAYHYSHNSAKIGEWVGIMLAIVIVYRILGYLVLVIKKH